jgi:hypothetical protein
MSATMKFAMGSQLSVHNADNVFTSHFPQVTKISQLKEIFTEIRLVNVTFKLVQNAPVGHGQLNVGGVIYCGLVPSSWTVAEITAKRYNAPELKMFGLGYENMIDTSFSVDLKTFEIDLAQTARRGALPQIVLASFGARAGQPIPVVTMQIIYEVQCVGEAYGA